MPNLENALPHFEGDVVGEELKKMIEQCIADEYEAASRYREISSRCLDERAKKILNDIANEEIVHVGEFQFLLKKVFPEEQSEIEKGLIEAEEKLSKDNAGSEEEDGGGEKEDAEEKQDVVNDDGSLKKKMDSQGKKIRIVKKENKK